MISFLLLAQNIRIDASSVFQVPAGRSQSFFFDKPTFFYWNSDTIKAVITPTYEFEEQRIEPTKFFGGYISDYRSYYLYISSVTKDTEITFGCYDLSYCSNLYVSFPPFNYQPNQRYSKQNHCALAFGTDDNIGTYDLNLGSNVLTAYHSGGAITNYTGKKIAIEMIHAEKARWILYQFHQQTLYPIENSKIIIPRNVYQNFDFDPFKSLINSTTGIKVPYIYFNPSATPSPETSVPPIPSTPVIPTKSAFKFPTRTKQTEHCYDCGDSFGFFPFAIIYFGIFAAPVFIVLAIIATIVYQCNRRRQGARNDIAIPPVELQDYNDQYIPPTTPLIYGA